MIFFNTPASSHLIPELKKRGEIGTCNRYKFVDGEIGYQLTSNVKNKQVTLVGSVTADPESLFDLAALAHVLEENNAKLHILIPYLGYARQDRQIRKGEAAIGVMIARIIKMLPGKKTVIDIHSSHIKRALGLSTKELSPTVLFAKYIAKKSIKVVVAPDLGAKKRARKLANLLNADVAVIEKHRPKPNISVAKKIQGDVRGKNVLIIDDMIDTGGTIKEAVRLLKKHGARNIWIAATHGIFSKNARASLTRLPIKEIIVTDTLPQIKFKGIRVLPSLKLL